MNKEFKDKQKVMTPLGKGEIVCFTYLLQINEEGDMVKVYAVRLDYRMEDENTYDYGILPLFYFTKNELKGVGDE